MKFIDNRKIIENTINFMGISNNKKIPIINYIEEKWKEIIYDWRLQPMNFG